MEFLAIVCTGNPPLSKRISMIVYSNFIHQNEQDFLYFLIVNRCMGYYPTTIGKAFLLWLFVLLLPIRQNAPAKNKSPFKSRLQSGEQILFGKRLPPSGSSIVKSKIEDIIYIFS